MRKIKILIAVAFVLGFGVAASAATQEKLQYGKSGLIGAGIFYGGEAFDEGIGGEIKDITNYALPASDNLSANEDEECEIIYTG